MTAYSRLCESGQRCTQVPQCGLDCHLKKADDLPITMYEQSLLETLFDDYGLFAIVFIATFLIGIVSWIVYSNFGE